MLAQVRWPDGQCVCALGSSLQQVWEGSEMQMGTQRHEGTYVVRRSVGAAERVQSVSERQVSGFLSSRSFDLDGMMRK